MGEVKACSANGYIYFFGFPVGEYLLLKVFLGLALEITVRKSGWEEVLLIMNLC